MEPKEAVCYLDTVLKQLEGQEDSYKCAEAVALARDILSGHLRRQGRPRPQVSSPAAAYGLVKDLARGRKERLVALYLDAQNCLIRRSVLSVGTLNTTRTHPREVLQPAIMVSACGFILAHNHPSGSLQPSQDDVAFTRATKRAAELVGIDLYDHIIVGKGWYTSLKEKGLV